ncbi:MAG: farnesyl-diphosphate synthase [Rhodospirillaceae bacterium]|nr:farnesyl-diphosphate synthase [Rhodospirillaceae bacterium]
MSEAKVLVPLPEAMAEGAAAVEQILDEILTTPQGHEARLFEAMRYASLNGGKRLRPFLALESARLFDVPDDYALRAGVAVELIHCYSLIHDDLPAMDDDDLRRGKPSCHIAFDEATAVLAGDALQAVAFEILADPKTHPDAEVRNALIKGLAFASGGHGMVGGQMIDLAAEHSDADVSTITRMQRLKTGALISFSCEAGAIVGRASDDARQALLHYAHDLGLAFQIADDLLDVLGTAEDTGKATQKDEAAGKATFVSLLGVPEAQERAKLLVDQAIARLDMFGEKAAHLRAIANFVVERRT